VKLRTSLMAAPALVCGVLVACLLGCLSAVNTFGAETKATYEVISTSERQLDVIQQSLLEQHVMLYRTMAIIGSLDDATVQARRAELPKMEATIMAVLATVSGHEKADDPERMAFQQVLHKYVQQADEAIDLSTVDPNTGVAALQSADAQSKVVDKQLDKLFESLKGHSDVKVAALEASLMRKQVLISVLGVLASMGAFSFAWVMQARIVRDVAEAVDAAEGVAQGRFDQAIHVQRDDEIGQLQSALARMVHELSSSLCVVQDAAKSIGQASTEIAAGNTDLSHRTESTASSLQETASSMVQLTGILPDRLTAWLVRSRMRPGEAVR
jgi:HAMP domain-containing protein